MQETGLAGLLWTWWQGDSLPVLSPIDGLRVTVPAHYEALSSLSGLDTLQVQARIQGVHRPYLAWIDSIPVAYGWSAAGETRFGSPPITFTVPRGSRYLLDFATLPAWRGRGIYPRLLQAILEKERPDIVRFWILHHRDNVASARGIERAGFRVAAEIHFLDRGGLGLVGVGSPDHTEAGADLLSLPIIRI
jgi:GNAT superfamily N-acetyltransferase